MQGRIHNGQAAALLDEHIRIDAQRLFLRNVVVVHFRVADDLQKALSLGLLHVHQLAVRIGNSADACGHARGGLRAQLSAVLAVDLIAVILGRIMTGGNDHARGSLQVTHGIGQDRHRAQRVEQKGMYALLAEHLRRFLRKQIGEAAAVISDDHAPLRRAGLLLQISRQTLGRTADVIAVHTVGARAQHAAHTGGAEAQLRIKTILDLCRVIANAFQLPNGLLIVREVLQPLFIIFLHVHGSIASFILVRRAMRLFLDGCMGCLTEPIIISLLLFGKLKRNNERQMSVCFLCVLCLLFVFFGKHFAFAL